METMVSYFINLLHSKGTHLLRLLQLFIWQDIEPRETNQDNGGHAAAIHPPFKARQPLHKGEEVNAALWPRSLRGRHKRSISQRRRGALVGVA